MPMKPMKNLPALRQRAPAIAAFFCAAFMLAAVPLLFHDAFFDINRYKVSVVCHAMPAFCALFGAALLIRGKPARRALRRGRAVMAIMAAFLLACVLSCALAGFEEAVLTGSEGRYCGLYFMLACGAAFLMIAFSAMDGRLVCCIGLVCAGEIAALGFANAMGADPLGFYARIRPGQESTFLSTIGHYDFFGTYLTLMLPLAGGLYVFGKRGSTRLFGAACAVVIAFGASASRTDSAFLSMHLGCAALLALSGGSWARLSRTLTLWGMCFLTLPVTKELLLHSVFQPEFNGLLLLLCEKPVALGLALALTFGGLLCALPLRRGVAPPSRRATMRCVTAALILLALLLAGGIALFTVILPEAEIGEAASFLRLNDQWGSLRGAVYIRAARAFADYSLPEKLFGRGMDLTLRVLTPYFDDPAILVGGVFNDTHCQPLQLLLTCGLFGSVSFVALYLALLALLARHAGDDFLLCGVLAALVGYGVTMLLNVTQPILIAAYFSVAALGVARVRCLSAKGEAGEEGAARG